MVVSMEMLLLFLVYSFANVMHHDVLFLRPLVILLLMVLTSSFLAHANRSHQESEIF
jgi:hypothetical protein